MLHAKEIAQLLEIPFEVLISDNGPTITFNNGTFEIGYVHANEFQHDRIELVEKVIFPLVEKLMKPLQDEIDFMKHENERMFAFLEKSVLNK